MNAQYIDISFQIWICIPALSVGNVSTEPKCSKFTLETFMRIRGRFSSVNCVTSPRKAWTVWGATCLCTTGAQQCPWASNCKATPFCQSRDRAFTFFVVVPGACTCQQCGKKFSRLEVLRVHIRDIHQNKGRMYKCDYCDKQSKSLNGLRQHMNTYHRSSVSPPQL